MKFRNLLVTLGLAVANLGAKYDPSGVAQKLLDAYAKRREQAKLREELDALIAARFENFREQLAEAMGDDRLQLTEAVRAQVEAYLSQFQASAKQAARILGDPSATTVPATVNINSAAELAAFLPQRPPRFTVGDSVPGLPSWKLTEPLGGGGFGEVWKAENPDDEVPVAAFKFFLDSDARTRFTRAEAAALREIHRQAPHDGVVKLRQAEPLADPPWLQFEYIGGGDLSRLPGEWNGLPGAKRIQRIQGAIRALAATAGQFHKLGVVHRDLKPSNVLIRNTGEGPKLVIADFGISKIVQPVGHVRTPSGSALVTIRAYTPVYASPQQKRGLPADVRDDVYSLGVLWYQLLRGDLTLERPGGDGWKEELLDLGVSRTDVELLNRCWDDSAERRPADGAELAQRLGGALPRAEPKSRPAPPRVKKTGIESAPDRSQTAPVWWILVAVAIALGGSILLLGALFMTSLKPTNVEAPQKGPTERAEPQQKGALRMERPSWALENGTLDPVFLVNSRWVADADKKVDDIDFKYFPRALDFLPDEGLRCERIQERTTIVQEMKDGKLANVKKTEYVPHVTEGTYSVSSLNIVIASNVRDGPLI
ncbi:protein kinase [Gemmata sp. G18]|uniref:Protein kinase n=1 Tax=Gemmata palustris TaxID=2822762 RepID=A0ABS5BPQ9_9BACT|nr:serine/threonine-protein kinase [Gemmata palustris]MBP3955650.1 protein kinase [Gemmata palustris]